MYILVHMYSFTNIGCLKRKCPFYVLINIRLCSSVVSFPLVVIVNIFTRFLIDNRWRGSNGRCCRYCATAVKLYPSKHVLVNIQMFLYPSKHVLVNIQMFLYASKHVLVNIQMFLYPSKHVLVNIQMFLYPSKHVLVNIQMFLQRKSAISVNEAVLIFSNSLAFNVYVMLVTLVHIYMKVFHKQT